MIVGGGINGCALARAAARSGLRTALLEKRDFGAGTTSRSTRLIHGGLRYLESFQLSLVRESLRDRERFLREFPAQVVSQPFLLPLYAGDSRPPWYLGLGLALYRLLAAGGTLPPHRRLGAGETLALLPGLDQDGLLGSFEYYDCQAAYPERIALAMALQAEEAGAEIRNHARVDGFLASGSTVEGVRCAEPDGEHAMRASLVVNAAGAWIDRVLGLLPAPRPQPRLTLVNGAHIVLPSFPGSPRHAVYREARSDRRPFFVVPWRGLYLVGTTETAFDGHPDRTLPSESEIRYLLDETNGLFPGAAVRSESILYAYAGSRPLLRSEAGSFNRASRGHEIVDHERTDGVRGLLTMAGGKLTTAPSFADETLRVVRRKLGLRPSPASAGAPAPPPSGVPARIASVYGPRSAELLRFLDASPGLREPLADGCAAARGEVLFAATREKAATLGDVFLRRTGLAHDPRYEAEWAERAAEICGQAFAWDAGRRSRELASYERERAETLLLE